MKKFALIVAGGSGGRMGNPTPKQFLKIGGKPILMQTIEVFEKFDRNIEIVVVLPEKQIEVWRSLCRNHSFLVPHKIIAGGKNRFHSVRNGLSRISGEGIVFIHDGVRPFVSIETIRRCLDTAVRKGNAVPAVPITESLRKVGNGNNSAVTRTDYYLVQTPQTFLLSDIKEAYQQVYTPNLTDDASVLEASGSTINLVEGNKENIKITDPSDLIIAEAYLQSKTYG